MAVATGVVPDVAVAATVALLDMAAEGGGAALLDGRHHPALRRGEDGPGLGPEGVAVAAEDLRLGERAAWHARRSVDVRAALRFGPWQEVQRTRGRADGGSRGPQVVGRGLQWWDDLAGRPQGRLVDSASTAERFAAKYWWPPRQTDPASTGSRRRRRADDALPLCTVSNHGLPRVPACRAYGPRVRTAMEDLSLPAHPSRAAAPRRCRRRCPRGCRTCAACAASGARCA